MRIDSHHRCGSMVRRMTFAIVGLGLVAAWLAVAMGQEMRTWTDKSGKFKIKAKLVESLGGKVVLELEDGTQKTIALDKLSEADQKAVAAMGSGAQDPFETVKPAKKAGKKTRVVDEEEEEPTPKRAAAKKKATVIDGDEEEPVKKPVRKKKAAMEEEESEEEEGEVSGEPKEVRPKWSGAKEVLAAPTGEKWSVSIEAPEQPAAAKKGRPIAIPSKVDFFERMKAVVVNPVCRRAVIGYGMDNRPGGGAPFGRGARGARGARGGGAGREGQTRIVLCDLQSGKALGAGVAPGKLIPLALSDSGEQVIMRREDAGFGKSDLLEIWALTQSGISRELQWCAHDESKPGAHNIQWARYLDEERFVTASSAGMLVVWRAANVKPLYYLKIQGHCRPALSPDRKYVAFATDKEIGLLDVAAGEVAAMQEAKRHLAFPAFAFTPKGSRLACSAHDRVLVWDMGTGALYREIPLVGLNVHVGENLLCPNEDQLFVGNSLLVDIDSQAKLWTYRGAEAAAMLGGVCWLVVSAHDSAGALVPTAMPHAAALDQIQKAMQSPDFFVVKPGSTVKVNVNGIADPAEREKAGAALAQKLQANGCQVAPNASIELVAATEMGKRQQLSYHGFGPFGGGSSTYNFQEYASRLKFVLQGQTLWETVASNNPGFMISLKQGETVEQFLRARERPNYEFFSTVELPKMVQKPTPGTNSIGVSQVSVAGVR